MVKTKAVIPVKLTNRRPDVNPDDTLRTRLEGEFLPTNVAKSSLAVAGDFKEFTAAEATLIVPGGRVIVLTNDFGTHLELRCQYVPSVPIRPRRGMCRTRQIEDPENAEVLRAFVREFVQEIAQRQQSQREGR